MRIIIGYGNSLRAEDAFGVDVINQLQEYNKKKALSNTKLISTFQLTPELCLELLEASEIIFIDALYYKDLNYSLVCSLESSKNTNLSHHISPEIIIAMLRDLYKCKVEYEIYSMSTCNFDKFLEKEKYDFCVKEISNFLRNN